MTLPSLCKMHVLCWLVLAGVCVQAQVNTDPEHEPLAAKFSVNTLERVYQYDPQPDALTDRQKQFIIGGQAAFWTEFVSSVEHLEYMLLPRLPAIAEALWTPLEKKEFSGFIDRLNGWHFNAWQQKGIRFHPGYYQPNP